MGRLADALYRVGDAAKAEQVAARALALVVERTRADEPHSAGVAQARTASGLSVPVAQGRLASPLFAPHTGC